MDFAFQAPRSIRFGRGALQEIGNKAAELGGTRALVVTSPGMVDRASMRVVLEALAAAGIEAVVFNQVSPDPPVEGAQACLNFLRANDCNLVIGLGGGSALDVAKIVAMLATNEGTVHNYFGIGKVQRDSLPTIMAPTTAGTGSEVSPDAVLVNRTVGTKRAVKDKHLIPTVAIVDPETTWTMSPELTAITGADALTHAIEAYISKRSSPLTNLMALQAMRLIAAHLQPAVHGGPHQAEARDGMALASLLAGLAFGNASTAAVHACAYPLSGMFGVPHGKANGLMLPYVTEFNLSSTPKYRDVQAIFGEELPVVLTELMRDIGLPTRLREIGVSAEDIPRMAQVVLPDTRHLSVNPREVSLQDLENIFQRAL